MLHFVPLLTLSSTLVLKRHRTVERTVVLALVLNQITSLQVTKPEQELREAIKFWRAKLCVLEVYPGDKSFLHDTQSFNIWCYK